MKRIGFLIIMTILGVQLFAGPRLIRAVSMSNNPYYTVENPSKGVDALYIFKTLDDASFETLNQENATWIDLSSQRRVARMNVFQSLEDGQCYQVVVEGDTTTFAVIDYSKHTIDSFKIEMDCKETRISYLPSLAMQYYNLDGQKNTYQFDVAVKYQNQIWDSLAVEWKTEDVIDSIQINKNGKSSINANLIDTKFEFVESKIYSEISDGDSIIVTDDSLYTAVAVQQKLQYYIAKRGKKLENEKEGPYGSGVLSNQIVHSAPLDVLFESHPSQKADIYTWTIKKENDVLTRRNDKDVRYTFDETSESGPVKYYAELVVMNSEHTECVDSAQVDITLNQSFIMVPNVFTPNGDGANDEFRVAYRSICEFHCWVFNRWQHLVYQWDDPAKGWDGTYNGRKEPDSAYLYIIEATGCDGQKFKLKGMVNLLRGK